MTCQEFWKSMPELSRAADPAGHLHSCPDCARKWERQRALVEGLRGLATDTRHDGAPDRVETRLLAAFRAHSGLGNSIPGRRNQPNMWIPVTAWFAAAAAVVTLAFFLVSNHPPQPAHRGTPKTFQTASLQIPVDSELAEESPYNNDGFIPLPNAERISPNENVNLVRVEVPRSTMIALGYDVSADRASEPVEAEVVLGADGLARAVRFLE